MSDCCSTCSNSCPEVVPVTVNQTLISLGDGASFQEELFSLDAATVTGASNTITLVYPPVSAANVQLFRNGVLQRTTVDYTIVIGTGVITLLSAATAGEQFTVKYLAVVE